MTKEQVIQGYLMNSPKVVAEMLYETIERYEDRKCNDCKKQNTFMCPVTSFDTNMEDFSCNKWQSK